MIIGFPDLTNGLYNFSINFVALSEEDPTTIRSGFRKSSTANPSLKSQNSCGSTMSTSGYVASSNSDLVNKDCNESYADRPTSSQSVSCVTESFKSSSSNKDGDLLLVS